MFARDMEYDPAGDQHRQTRRPGQQPDDAGARCPQMLEVVQHEQQLPGAQGGEQALQRVAQRYILGPVRVGDSFEHELRVAY
jgi:hypothetical protein